ncbi:hypothetical protein ACHQM5_016496 [Ranunculus cassubicifolius]
MAFQFLPVCLCLFLFLLGLIWQFMLRKHSKTQTLAWPLAGSVPVVLWYFSGIYEGLNEAFLSIGDGVGSFFLQGPFFTRIKYLVTCHPENMEYILKTNFSNFPKGPDFKQIFEVLGDGILNDDGESWHLQRKLVHSCFRAVEFRSVYGQRTLEVVEDQLVPFLAHAARKRSVIDLQDMCTRFVFDSNMKAVFGREERYLSCELRPNEFAKAMDVTTDAIFHRHILPMFLWKLMRFLNVGKEKCMAEAWRIIDLIIEERISSKRELFTKGEGNVNDLLSMLLKSSDVNDKLVRDVMLNLLFAGKDTLASALVWFFYMVTKAPHIEKKIIEELKSVALKKNSGDVGRIKAKWPLVFDTDDLKDIVYLHAALCESLRLNAPLPFNNKGVVKRDMLPDGTVVMPGTQILVSYYSEGRMPWIWGDDSLEFKPERWIGGDGKLNNELSSKFFVFNVGPRSCLGKDISFTQMKVCIAAVLFNFHVDLVEGQQVCSKPSVNLHMKNGLLVHIKKRLVW